MRIAQPFMFGKMTGDKFTVKLFWQTKYSQAILIYKKSQEIDFRQENARYRDQMNFDHQIVIVSTENDFVIYVVLM